MDRIFKRKIYDDLLKWKTESRGRTAILIEGARRVGKTTVVKEFARNEYRSFIYIDFLRKPRDIIRIIEDNYGDLDRMFLLLQRLTGVTLYDRNSAGWSDIADVEFERMERDRFVAGEFVWTGIDYLGEPSPYEGFGARSSYFGICDLMVFPKDRFYLYRSHWNRDVQTVHIVPSHWNFDCKTLPVWEGLNRLITNYLSSITLEDIIEGRIPMPKD